MVSPPLLFSTHAQPVRPRAQYIIDIIPVILYTISIIRSVVDDNMLISMCLGLGQIYVISAMYFAVDDARRYVERLFLCGR